MFEKNIVCIFRKINININNKLKTILEHGETDDVACEKSTHDTFLNAFNIIYCFTAVGFIC